MVAEFYRSLTEQERSLARWMLDHATSDAGKFIEQLARAQATSWRCPCGCASFHFKVDGLPIAPPGVTILAEFIFGSDDSVSGIFIYESAGTLSGVEIYGLDGDAPRDLPAPGDLRPFGASASRPA